MKFAEGLDSRVAMTASVKPRRKVLRVTLVVLSVVSSVTLPVWAIVASSNIPASNQYCMATTVIGALFAATLGTNLIYLWINACLARRVAYASPNSKGSKCVRLSQCLSHHKALQIVRDMKAVLAVKDQFTLADVLPSSLDASLLSNHSGASHHASVRSHHSAGGAHSQNQNDSGHFRRQQPSADKSMMSDGLCHNQDVE